MAKKFFTRSIVGSVNNAPGKKLLMNHRRSEKPLEIINDREYDFEPYDSGGSAQRAAL